MLDIEKLSQFEERDIKFAINDKWEKLQKMS